MIIIALYKLFRGREFLIPSLQSIYNHVDKIVAVSSDIGWDGEPGNNTLDVVETFPDPLKKIIILRHNTISQAEQYEVGFKFIQTKLNASWILLIDSDEVWDEAAWEKALEYLWNCAKDNNGFTANMHTAIKHPLYRVDDSKQKQVKPMIFIRPTNIYLGIRGNAVEPHRFMYGVCIFHFALVRDSIEEVFRKMKTSHIGDKYAPPLVNLTEWKEKVWDKIPGTAYHYYVGCQNIWQKTIAIEPEELPITVRNMKKWPGDL